MLRVAVVVAVSGATTTLLPMPARSAPACTPTPPAAVATEVPWAQQRSGLDRLSRLATGAGVVVAVVDSGVDATHPQLSGAVGAGLDLLDTGGDGRTDCVGHGTAVASIIAARPLPGTPFHGVAPGAIILPVRVSERVDGPDGAAPGAAARSAPVAAVAGALRQAVDRGAGVVNLSLTTEHDDPALRDAVRYARSRDVVLVAAAGNRYAAGNPRPYPAAYEGVLGVGAVLPDGTRAPQSQTGDHVDLVAPGAEVTAAARGAGHRRHTGTSFAAAYVAGAAALVRQYHPALTATQVAARLLATADPAGGGATRDATGSGLVDPYRAVTATAVSADRPAIGPAVVAGADRTTGVPAAEQHRRQMAYRFAIVAAVAALLLLLGASTVRHGRRRRWRTT